jgi:hypothetical protein
MGEVKITPKFSAAGIFGYGSVALQSPYQSSRLKVLEAGAQVLFYPVGDFENGMQLGVEALCASVTGNVEAGRVAIKADGQALGVGGLIGYKYIAPIGFALTLQGGAGYNAAVATASADTVKVSATNAAVYPIVNLNFGWAF